MNTIHALSAVLVAGALVLCSLAAAQPVPPTTLDEVVILANGEVTFGSNSKLASGQAVVNADGGAARLASRFGALANTLVVADVVDSYLLVGDPPFVEDVIANETDPSLVVNGSTAGATFPIFDPFPSTPTVSPGGTDVLVRRANSPLLLDAGDYGKIRVAVNGVLYFTGGTYNVREIRARKRASLLFMDATTLNVAERFRIGRNARFMPVDPNLSSRCVVVNVAPAAPLVGTLGLNGKMFATINAPASKIKLGAFGEFTGQFIGDTIRVARMATVWADTPCP